MRNSNDIAFSYASMQERHYTTEIVCSKIELVKERDYNLIEN